MLSFVNNCAVYLFTKCSYLRIIILSWCKVYANPFKTKSRFKIRNISKKQCIRFQYYPDLHSLVSALTSYANRSFKKVNLYFKTGELDREDGVQRLLQLLTPSAYRVYALVSRIYFSMVKRQRIIIHHFASS